MTQPGEQLTIGQVVERCADALHRDRRDTPVLDHAAALVTADQHLTCQLRRADRTRTVAGLLTQPHYPHRLARWAAAERIDPADMLDALGAAGATLGHYAAYRLAADGFGAAAVRAFATHHPHLDPATAQQAFLVGWRDAGGTLADRAAVAAPTSTVADGCMARSSTSSTASNVSDQTHARIHPSVSTTAQVRDMYLTGTNRGLKLIPRRAH